MKRNRPAIFRGRHFEPEIIATCVRWYLRFSLSLRNVEEMMAERGRMVDHTNGLALVSKVRSGDLSPVARKAEIHDHHLAYGRNLRSDRRPVGKLTRSDSRIRTKPVAANTTGSLSRIGHDGTIITTPYLRRVQINGRWTLLASMGRSFFISAEGLPTLIASVCLPPECEVQFEVGNVRLGTMYTSR